MRTNIYHIAYSSENKEVALFSWGCNINCKGCYCKRRIYSPMLEDFVGEHLKDPQGIADAPTDFLSLEDVMALLSKVELKSVILEGQEASLDPSFSELTEALHAQFGSFNTLLTNGLVLPDLKHVDKVEVGIKSIDDEIHHDYTGVSNVPILENFKKLHDAGANLLVESVLIPKYIEADEIERVAKFVASVDEDIPFVILPYFKSGDNPWRRPFIKEMKRAERLVKKHLKTVFYFRGDEELDFEVESLVPLKFNHTVHPFNQKVTTSVLFPIERDEVVCPA